MPVDLQQTEGAAFHPEVSVVSFPDKGRGIVANSDLGAGIVVVRETPLLVSACSDYEAWKKLATRIMESDVQKCFSHLCALPPGTNTTSFCDIEADSERDRKVFQQIKANAFCGKSPDGRLQLCLFSLVSFCNHSCEPNAALSRPRKESDGERALYTLRQIPRGEELTICYDSNLLWLPQRYRKARTAKTWGFECRCQRCVEELSTQGTAQTLPCLDRFFDLDGRLADWISREEQSPGKEAEISVTDVYEESCELQGADHWQTHVAREELLMTALRGDGREIDFDILLEHIGRVAMRVPPAHPHFLTWFEILEKVVASNGTEVARHAEWREEVSRLRGMVAPWRGVLALNSVAEPTRAPRRRRERQAEGRPGEARESAPPPPPPPRTTPSRCHRRAPSPTSLPIEVRACCRRCLFKEKSRAA
eukprot:CAMPEP_0177605720 /NCGR_PEP_ID=MMETSP0419_2-20121207/16863_1 /TAXON_ID=582737 /ORGANISM="Tetraselmis sp., Strain GSL018" /LENGTH=421 /DNA_ID=CAMNT_0019099911 /DNA_START=668 /DNA_END=1929 /DNA_ORIENTATION=-